jgi:hypothetical protein
MLFIGYCYFSIFTTDNKYPNLRDYELQLIEGWWVIGGWVG